jgi:predicted nucleic acid-binding Zn ribbon protein
MINRRQGQDCTGPEPIGEVLSRLFVARGWGRKQDRLRLESAWAVAAGPQAAANTRVGALKRGVLEVEVIGAVLMQELANFRKRPILQKLREQLPGVTVSDLRFRAGG